MERPPALVSLGKALGSRRTASVTLLSFASGMPLGLVWIAIPDWMRDVGVDIRVVGLITLAQAPWTFKMLWSPLMDRYALPVFGRRLGWAALCQVALFALTLCLAGVGHYPETPWVVGALAFAIAFAAATQDIAIDAYAVDVLRPEEQAVAVGARIAVYRAAMFVAGGLAITLAGFWSWPVVNVLLALLYLPMLLVTRGAPEPEERAVPPTSLRQAVWLPFLGLLARHRALEILAFVLFYKLADNLAQALLRPFLHDMGYTNLDRGVSLTTVGLVATIAGTFLGGSLTNVLGLGHSLWIFGFLQIFSNLGYILVAGSPVNRPLMYGAMTFETLTTGLGMGAFGVLLLRMTERRFSATQYALFSSLFALPRVFCGPITGYVVHSVGWTWFFWATIVAGVPGMVLLARFVPLGVREPTFTVEAPPRREPLGPGALLARGLAGFGLGTLAAGLLAAGLDALRVRVKGGDLDWVGALASLTRPEAVADWIELLGVLVAGLFAGVFTAAVAAARHRAP